MTDKSMKSLIGTGDEKVVHGPEILRRVQGWKLFTDLSGVRAVGKVAAGIRKNLNCAERETLTRSCHPLPSSWQATLPHVPNAAFIG